MIENWSKLDEESCPCQGKGWAKFQDWDECPFHYMGQLHPDSFNLLKDDLPKLQVEEQRSRIKYQITVTQSRIDHFSSMLEKDKKELELLKYKLVNSTPTIEMPIIKIT